jgi:Sap, sulfolipid-1-addressing protein
MGEIVLLSLTAALNPTLLTATTVLLLLPGPQRLMVGYWLGAMVTSIVSGLILVSVLQGTGAAHSTKRTVSPLVDLGLAAIALIVAAVLATGRDRPLEERRAERRASKEPPRWQRRLENGTPRTTFVVGILLSFPGASYIAALNRLGRLHYSTTVTVLVVIGIVLVQLLLLEIPMVAFQIAPRRTPAAVDQAKAWTKAHGKAYAVGALTVIGIWLTVRGIIELM